MRSHLLVAVLAVSPGSGCALLAVKPPTPAADLRDADLARTPPAPGERYYLMVFGSQSVPKQTNLTHTWATLVRVVERPGGEPAVECHTISWMPATLDIEPFRFRVEPGVNRNFAESLEDARSTGQRISAWGPYEVWHGFAPRFLVQKAFLESGRVGYQCVDSVGEAARTGGGCDCIHAVTDLDPAYDRFRYPLLFYGETASGNVVRRLMHSPIFLDPPRTHDWLLPKLGLDGYRVERREYRGRSVPHVPGGPAGLEVAPRPAAVVLPVPLGPRTLKDTGADPPPATSPPPGAGEKEKKE